MYFNVILMLLLYKHYVIGTAYLSVGYTEHKRATTDGITNLQNGCLGITFTPIVNILLLF